MYAHDGPLPAHHSAFVECGLAQASLVVVTVRLDEAPCTHGEKDGPAQAAC